MTVRTTIESQAKALAVAQAALDKHAEAVQILDLRSLSTVTDFFVVATAASYRQMRAITEYVEQVLAKHGKKVQHIEGTSDPEAPGSRIGTGEAGWLLIDCGDVVLHVFDPPGRQFYQLERLWGDAPRVPLKTE